jgi:hypothetical protein
MNIETNSNGYLVISDIDDQGYLFTEQYLYYTKSEAVESFQYSLDERNNSYITEETA